MIQGDEEYLTAVVKPGEMKQQDTARRLFDPFRLNVDSQIPEDS